MKKLNAIVLLLIGSFAASVGFAPRSVRSAEPARIRGLFLGDKGHHEPASRFPQLAPVLESRGIDLEYTEDLSALNLANLEKYDFLMIYANIEKIDPAGEKALLDYVAGGGGFVPLHCASFCFLNSQAYVDLVGAQFWRHGTGEFDVKVVVPDHPIMKGLKPFHTWDETYVHKKHNTKDRTVLQTRAEGGSEEPWTWTRTHGKGRVFYTAYGHDERTWGNPGFHDLIERGIRWASAEGAVFDSRPVVPAVDRKPFEYVPAKVPNYLPAARRWGEQGEPFNTMQKPLDPAESMKHMALPRGFRAELFASEPDIAKPITMAWDHRGRLWVVESFDYPNSKKPEGQGSDRIKICEDTDGDGKADKFTIFADKLSIPASLTFARGGVIVHQVPHTLFLKDTDGDDKADIRETLFTGWDTGDTHAGPSNLRWGFDNWIYSIDGYAGFSGSIGGERVRFRMAIFRFKPDGSKLEVLRNTSNNSWGVGFSEEGLVFGSTANGCPSVFMAIPNRYYEGVRGWSPSVLESIADTNRYWPITDKVRQVDWFGGFTAAAGHALYTAREYPKVYWNKTAFVAEPTGHLTATFTLEPRGAGFRSHNSWNLLASDDEWTSPIMAEVGPDGNVWIIDWYSYIVQHNPTPQGFKTGKGSAYETPLRDKTHGRIYRIVHEASKPYTPIQLDPKNPTQLVAVLKSTNMFWRLTAQRLLVERGKTDVVPDLVEMLGDKTVDDVGLNPPVIHALWTLHGLGRFDGKDAESTAAATAALRHPSAGVRRAALLVLPEAERTGVDLLEANLLEDDDAQVRLAALLKIADLPASDALAKRVAEFLAKGGATGDRLLAEAATSAAAKNAVGFIKAIAALDFGGRGANAETIAIAGRVSGHLARGGDVKEIEAILTPLIHANMKIQNAVIAGLSDGWPRNRKPGLSEEADRALVQLMLKLSSTEQARAAAFAERIGAKGIERFAGEIADRLAATVADEKVSDSERIDAANRLIMFKRNAIEPVKRLITIVTPRTSPALALGLIEAIGSSENRDAGGALVESLASFTPSVRAKALRVLLSRGDWTEALLNGAAAGKARLDELALDQRQALLTHPNSKIADRARKLIGEGGGTPDADRQKVIDSLAPLVLKGGDPGRGKVVFEQQCAKCHMHSGKGNVIGPDLTGMSVHPREELLIHILDPSRSVEGNFVQYSVSTTDGLIMSGLLSSESKTSIELLDSEGKRHTIERDRIEELVASKKSLMPEGFEKQVPAEGIADLLAFLTQHGKYVPIDLRKSATVVTTKGMFYSEESDIERLVFDDWTPKTFAGIPFMLVDPRGDRIPNAIMLRGPEGLIPPKMPRSATVPCHIKARAFHLLSGVSGWGFAGGQVEPTVSMIVRIHYADGKTEDHPLKNGVHFADYIRVIDVPESKLAFNLGGRQLRYLAIEVGRDETVESIEFIKGRDRTAPIVMAVTAELRE